MEASRWNEQIIAHGGSFLQSWEWGEMQRAYGRNVERFFYNDLALQVITYPLISRLGFTYLFAPGGPVMAESADAAVVADCENAVRTYAEQEQAIFFRYEAREAVFGGNTVKAVHPTHTHIVDLQEPEKMLESFKQKWRYNIRLAERKGVSVRRSQSMDDNETVYNLLRKTADQQGIAIHPKAYYAKMMEVLGPKNMMHYYIAEHEGVPIAANIAIGYGKTFTYLHGGSDAAYRALMAPHALQWQAMQDAYAEGYAAYDFFGVAPPNEPKHPFAGITRFKHGFQGQDVYVGETYDLSMRSMWYTAYNTYKHLRTWI